MPSASTPEPAVVLVTGVSRFLGSSLAGRLASYPHVKRVIGVDAVVPDTGARRRAGGAEFHRIDIRGALIADIIDKARIDTVVHASASIAPVAQAARAMTKEMNVLGTMQLLSACQRSTTVRRVVVRSTAAIYGSSHREPSIVDEHTVSQSEPVTAAARDAIDIEAYVRAFSRRRPDIRVVLPRFVEIIGPTVQTPLTRYFSLWPVVPIIAGYDPRLQLVHEQDAVRLLEYVAFGDMSGPVNVAGDGILTLMQAIRLAGRTALPVPGIALDTVTTALRLARIRGFSSQQLRLLGADRVLDTGRLRAVAGFSCRYTTREAFEDFAKTIKDVGMTGSLRTRTAR